MPRVRTQIDPDFNLAWLANKGQFHSFAEELDEEGRWAYTTANLDAALDLIAAYPVLYLEIALPEARALIVQRGYAAFLEGFTVSTGPLAGHTLQCRDTEDRTNWLASQVGYSAAIALGYGSVLGATFRTATNETVKCTYAEGSAVLLEMQRWGAAIMARTWELKDAAAAAADIFELDEVLGEINSGWPATAAV